MKLNLVAGHVKNGMNILNTGFLSDDIIVLTHLEVTSVKFNTERINVKKEEERYSTNAAEQNISVIELEGRIIPKTEKSESVTNIIKMKNWAIAFKSIDNFNEYKTVGVKLIMSDGMVIDYEMPEMYADYYEEEFNLESGVGQYKVILKERYQDKEALYEINSALKKSIAYSIGKKLGIEE